MNEQYSNESPTIKKQSNLFPTECELINHYQSSLLTYGVDLNIDSEKIIIETMNLAEEINDEFFPNNRLIIMKNTIFNNRDDIFDYWDYLEDQKLGYKEMATYKWNIYAKSKLKSDG